MDTKLANPAPLGLMGFGMTTILLNIHNAGFYEISAMILAMGIFYGGIAQVIAGRLEFHKGNTFGVTAFTSYGLFWLSLVALLLFPEFGWAEATPAGFMGWYLFLWGVFTLFMFFGTLKGATMLQVVFATLTVLFFLLAIGDWTGNATITKIAGWEGILCGASAFYLAMGEVLNEALDRVVLPIDVAHLPKLGSREVHRGGVTAH
ncbi:MAG TPA: acetate uptake transporter [Acidimicrobiia bacterium]|nr:acetate uptake transporter [Acidimicrobiia bacterium]